MNISNSIWICTKPVECAIKVSGGGNKLYGIQIYCNTDNYSFWERIKLGLYMFWLIVGKKQ